MPIQIRYISDDLRSRKHYTKTGDNFGEKKEIRLFDNAASLWVRLPTIDGDDERWMDAEDV